MSGGIAKQLDGVLTSNLADICYNIQRHDWDWLNVIDGNERTGKSNNALWLAKFASDAGLKFDWEGMSHVFLKEKHLHEKLIGIPNNSVVIIDEGGENLFSRTSMRGGNIKMVQTLMAYAAKNIFLIICIPNWRWIDVYIREARVRSVLHSFSVPKWEWDSQEKKWYMVRERGFYSFYSRRRIVGMNQEQGFNKGFKKLEPNFSGKIPFFGDVYKNEWAAYRDKKMSYLAAREAAPKERLRREELNESAGSEFAPGIANVAPLRKRVAPMLPNLPRI